MARTLNLDIQETAQELRSLFRKQTNAHQKERVHVLYLLKSGEVTTLEALSKVIARDTSTIYRWLQKYKSEGLPGLLKLYEPAGRPLTIPPLALERLQQKLHEDPEAFKRYGEIQIWLKEECGVEVDYHVVYRTVRYKLKAKFKASKRTSLRKEERAAETLPTPIQTVIKQLA